MSIYKGYAIFRKSDRNKIALVAKEFLPEGTRAGASRAGPHRFIEINEEDSIEEQVKSVIHELLHMGYFEPRPQRYIILEFPLPKGISKQKAIGYLDELDDRIDREMEYIYKYQPVLVNHLRKRVQELYLEKLEYFI